MESPSRLQEDTHSPVKSGTVRSEAVFDREQAGLYTGIVAGALAYAIGWIVVIPYVFDARRPSSQALTLVMVIIALIIYGLTARFVEEWSVVVDQDRLSERVESAEDRRAYRLLKGYWPSILAALLLVLFVVATELL